MEHILILNSNGFPNKFNDIHEIAAITPEGQSSITYVENKIIHSLNAYNKKLNITSIEYNNELFVRTVPRTKFSGGLIERHIIPEEQAMVFQEKGYTITRMSNSSDFRAEYLLAYVFISAPIEESRNVLFSQQIFPTVGDLLGHYLNSPSYTIANHPIYFINIINTPITANELLRRITEIRQMDIHYIEILDTHNDLMTNPFDIEKFIRKHYRQDPTSHPTITTQFFDIDFINKKITFTTDLLIRTKINHDDRNIYSFNGSVEKPYMTTILSMFLLGYKNGYNIDYTALKDFIRDYDFNESDKIVRFKNIIKYFDKFSK